VNLPGNQSAGIDLELEAALHLLGVKLAIHTEFRRYCLKNTLSHRSASYLIYQLV